MLKNSTSKISGSNKDNHNDETITKIIYDICKIYGQGSVVTLESDVVDKVSAVSSGFYSLDKCSGIGGFPRGRIMEIFGHESSGKTTLALKSMAEFQKVGGVVAFIDAEYALDQLYAQKLGVNLTKNFILCQPSSAEEALDITYKLVDSQKIDLVVIDSVAALVPSVEVKGNMGDYHVGLQSRLMSQALRKLPPICKRSNCTIIFINQIRMKVGVLFGNPETTTGGNALKFCASMRIETRRGATIKDGDQVLGHNIGIKIIKNKLAPPYRETTVELIYDKLDQLYLKDLFNYALAQGALTLSGSWIKLNDQNLGQGKEAAFKVFCDHKDMITAVTQKLDAKAGD